MIGLRLLLRSLLGRRLPRRAGTVALPGPAAPITIRRDRWGIPVIEAHGDADAWFGLGYCHAQDRAAQLDVLRRASSGTLSELIGKEGLPIDRLARRIGFRRSADRQLPVLAPDVRKTVDHYVLGLNAGSQRLPRKPHEFAILGGEPAPWDSVDVAAYLKLQSLLIGSNWDVELARLQILLVDGPAAVEALDPAPVNNGPLIDARHGSIDWLAARRLTEDLRAFLDGFPGRGGSNSWAIAGSRTASGRPIIANDPHVGPTLPAPWYLAHVRTSEWAVCGATMPGTPGFIAGHNGFAAWGSTAGLLDNTDLFVEEIAPDGASVREGDRWVPCEVVEERIAVKGRPDVVERVLVTARGPIVSPALEGIDRAISMRAVWLDPLPARGLLDVHKARSFEAFRAPFREWPVTPQHLVYADTSGELGWQLAGTAPIRKKGWGMVPLFGSDPEAGWSGLVPFDEMPHAENPEAGFYATANNPPLPEGEGPFLGYDWVNGYRASVISDALAARSDWDVEGCLKLQTSRRCKPWEEIRDAILAIPAGSDGARRGLDLLRAWNGELAPQSAAASIYEFLMCELAQRVCRAKAPNSYEWALGKGYGGLVPHTLMADRRFGHLVTLIRTQPPGWFAKPWPEVIAEALTSAVAKLTQTSGRSVESAAWGAVRTLTFKHLIFGDIPILGRAFNVGPMPGGGDSNTPFQSTVQPLDPLAPPAYLPSLRMVLDVGGWSASRFVIAGGQSGNPLSPHYDDLLEVWKRGEGVPISWTPEEIAAATVETLRLEPAHRPLASVVAARMPEGILEN